MVVVVGVDVVVVVLTKAAVGAAVGDADGADVVVVVLVNSAAAALPNDTKLTASLSA